MSKTNSLNINVNKDDHNINDFLFCWSELGIRPSKSVVYKNFNAENFLNYFEKSFTDVSIHKDIIPFDDQDIINERYFCKIENFIWATFTIFDSVGDDPFIGELSFYYRNDKEGRIDEILEDLRQFQSLDEVSNEVNDNNLFSIVINQNGFDKEKISSNIENLENIDHYYNDDTFKKVKKTAKKIKDYHKGLTIIYGERGTGKTSLIKYLSHKVKTKNILCLPTTLFDTTINNSEFRMFLKNNTNSVLVLDDCEIHLSDLYSKSNIFTNNLLQLVDGIESDDIKVNLILILNCKKWDDIDPHLLESNNLLDLIFVDYLDKTKVKDLSTLLDKKNKHKSPKRLIEVLKDRLTFSNESDIGFQ